LQLAIAIGNKCLLQVSLSLDTTRSVSQVSFAGLF